MNWKQLKKPIVFLIYISHFIVFTYIFFICWDWNVKLNFTELITWLAVEIPVGYTMFNWLFGVDYARKIYEKSIERDKHKELEQEKAKENLIQINAFEEQINKTKSPNEPVDSDWSLYIKSNYERRIGKCIVLLNGIELPWWDIKGRYRIIEANSAANARIPKNDFTEDTLLNAEGEFRYDDNIKKFKFKDLDGTEKLLRKN